MKSQLVYFFFAIARSGNVAVSGEHLKLWIFGLGLSLPVAFFFVRQETFPLFTFP